MNASSCFPKHDVLYSRFYLNSEDIRGDRMLPDVYVNKVSYIAGSIETENIFVPLSCSSFMDLEYAVEYSNI
jgi:hypothetical protein